MNVDSDIQTQAAHRHISAPETAAAHPPQVLLRMRARVEPVVTALLLGLPLLSLRDHIMTKTLCLVYSPLRISASTRMSGGPCLNPGRRSTLSWLASSECDAPDPAACYLHEKEKTKEKPYLHPHEDGSDRDQVGHHRPDSTHASYVQNWRYADYS